MEKDLMILNGIRPAEVIPARVVPVFIWYAEIEIVENQILGRLKIKTQKDNFKSKIKRFKAWLREYLNTTGANINLYLDYRTDLDKATNLNEGSKGQHFIAIKKINDELCRLGKTPDMMKGIKGFKGNGNRHIKFGINNDTDKLGFNEMEVICEKLKKADLRTKTIFSLLIFQGLRGCEIINLDTSDINFKTDVIHLLRKGETGKKPAPLHPETTKILKMYIESIPAGMLFTSISNSRRESQRLGTGGLRKTVITFLKNECQIYDKTPHAFRHAFVTRLLDKTGGDLRFTKNLTGHENIGTLQIYDDARLLKKDLPKFYTAFENLSF
jgi:site-specific recombinase XerD